MIFSIIVPVYKVELYLPQCIESVLNQDFDDFELILIDDGSPDNCGKICDKYATLDDRITVIHKKNGGLSDARNAGIEVSKGDYLFFLDSDDYLVKSALKDIFSVIRDKEKADIITCSHINLYPNGEEKYIGLSLNPLCKIVNREHLYNEFIKNKDSNWSAGKNIYSSKIIKSKNLRFKKGLIGAEDCDFFMNYVRESNNFMFLNTPLIYYRQNREGSITASMSKKAIIGQLQVFSENYFIYSNFKPRHTKMQNYFANKFANTISLLFNLDDEKEIKECIDFIIKYKEILKKTKGFKYLIAKLVWLICGYYNGSILLNFINTFLRKR